MLCCKQRPVMMSNANWMKEDENDFEIASCLDACGQLFRCKCNKTGRPLRVPENVPDVRLNADHFDVHQVSGCVPRLPNLVAIVPCTRSLPLQTFRHGLPHQPSCLAYDSEQQLLAIGSHQGEITMYPLIRLTQHCIYHTLFFG